MKHLFIVNPVAGGKNNDRTALIADIKRTMAERAEPYDIYITAGRLDACEKIREEAAACDKLRVYACGGDGTLNECVNVAVGLENVSITNYPCGTGNDFVKMFGKTAKEKFTIEALIDGEERRIDVIDCNGRCGINICSIGVDARIGTEVHKYSSIPVIGGATGYVVSLAVNLARGVTQHMKIRTPSGEYDEKFTLVCACNGRFYGGGFNPVPDADPCDGLMDCLIIKAVSRARFLALVGKYAKGKYDELGSLVTHERITELEIEADEEVVVNIDGEAATAKKLTFRMLPGAVNFVFPKGLEFFNKNESIAENTEV
ncbi:MAG: diacylglycerol kinase family lipid kinase [Oscillospiraceae bacterium]|nr:diacylglycerol kinase family lipid kinase [Oscillospiraceae bacterium]